MHVYGELTGNLSAEQTLNGSLSSIINRGVDVVSVDITTNGTYTAPSGKAYSPVTVTVPQPSGTKQINIVQNGTVIEDVTNFANAEVVVNVPQPSGGLLSVIDTITATENTRSLNIDYTEYSAYDIVIVAQDIELTSSDWLYYNWDTTEPSGGSYNNGSRVKHTGVATWKLPLGGSSRNIVGAVSNMTFTETSNNINNVIIYTYTATKLIKAGSTLTVYGGNLNG